MKHIDPTVRTSAERWLDQLGVKLSPETLTRALRHLDWVLAQNETLNLTAITDPAEAVRLHLVDSLAGLPEVEDSPVGHLADVGTGAGFPGIPLALATTRPTVLVDSVRKKCEAIQSFLDWSGEASNIATHTGRAEEPGSRLLATFSVVTMRAVAPLPSLVELASPLLAPGGRFVAWKGDLSEEEMSRACRVADLVGLVLVSTRTFSLPERHETRTIVSFGREGEPKVALPRRIGLAQKRPLA